MQRMPGDCTGSVLVSIELEGSFMGIDKGSVLWVEDSQIMNAAKTRV